MAFNVYKVYRNSLLNCLSEIRCPLCLVSMLPKFYEKHVFDSHDLNPKICCVFCRLCFWPVGQKRQNGPHLRECWKTFFEKYKIHEISFLEQVSIQQTCRKNCNIFHCDEWARNFNKIPDGWDNRPLYKPLIQQEEKDTDWLKLPVEDLMNEAQKNRNLLALFNKVGFAPHTGLSEAPYWIQRFIYYGGMGKKYGFYHLCIRSGCMESFVKEVFEKLRKDGKIVALPYWCVCDASSSSKDDDDTWQHHRHMIIVAKSKDLYTRTLSKMIRYDGAVIPRNGKRYYSKEIKTIGHFISTIVYVSSPRSKKCQRFDNEKKIIITKNYHYYIGNYVVPHARFWLTLLAPGNEMDRVCRFLAGSKSIYNMRTLKRNTRTKSWQVSASEILCVNNCVVLFDSLDWYVTNENIENLSEYIQQQGENSRFVYWFDGRVMKMLQQQSADIKEYISNSKKSLNVLFNAANNDFFTLSKHQQMQINDFVKYEEKRDLKMNEELQEKLKRLDDKWRIRFERTNSELKMCQEEISTLRKERIIALERELKDCREYYSKENKELKRKLQNSNKRVSHWKSKCLAYETSPDFFSF